MFDHKAWNQPLLAGDIPIPGYGRPLPYTTYLCISSRPQRQAPPRRLRGGDPKMRRSLARTSTLLLGTRAPFKVTTLGIEWCVHNGHRSCILALCLTPPWQVSPAAQPDSGNPASQGTAKWPNPAMPLLAGRLCSPADRLLAVHRRFAKQKGHGRVSSAMARARAMGNARGWDEREREREGAN